MLIYIILVLLLAFAAFVVKDRRFGLCCILLMFLIVIFRAESVGIDTSAYMRSGLSDYWQSGAKAAQFIYAFLTSLMAKPISHLLIVTFPIFTFGGILIACRRFGVRPAAAFFFFILFEFYNLSMNIARQYAAAGLLIVAYSYLFEEGRKRLWFFPLVFLSTGFHASSYAFFFMYFCRYINISKFKRWHIFAVFMTIYALYSLVLKNYYINLIQSIDIVDSLTAYTDYFKDTEDNGLTMGGFIVKTLMLIASIYILTAINNDQPNKVRILSSLFLVSIIMDLFFSEIYGDIGRLRNSIDIINIIAYSYYFTKVRDKRKLIIGSLVTVAYGYEYLFFIMGTGLYTIPYKFDFWLI